MLREPLLQRFPSYLKLIFLLMIVLASLLVTLLVGLIIAIPVFGFGVFDEIMNMGGSSLMENIDLQKYFQIVSQLGTFIIPSLIFTWLASRHLPSYLRLNRKPKLYTLIAGSLLIVLFLPFISWLAEMNEHLSLPEFLAGLENWMRQSEEQAMQLTEAFMADATIKGLLINLFMIGLLAAVGEELLFRGVLVRLFQEWFRNVHVAIWLSAFLFSALHLQFYGFLPRLLLGVVLGYLFVWSGSLWIPVIIHFVNNGVAVVAMFLYNRGTIQTDLESFGKSDNTAVILTSLILVSVLLVSVYYYQKKVEPSGEEIQDHYGSP